MNGAGAIAPRLGDILIERGITTQDQIDIALIEQKQGGEYLGRILVRLGFATEAVIRDVISGVIGQESVDLAGALADREAIAMIPRELARRLGVLPLTWTPAQRRLKVAMADTFNVAALDQLNAHLGGRAEAVPVLAGEAEIEKAIDRFYGFELSVDGILREIETGEIDYQGLAQETAEHSQPVARLVDALLADAVKHNASDIHFEPEQGFLRFRYRIDGVLRQIRSLHKNYWSALAVRLKVMAGMDIAETRAPQDGRLSLSLAGRSVDFRVSALPTVHGENIVLRVLDRQKGIVALDRLGLAEAALKRLYQMLARPEGIILISGPTGSGKTTTLYSILHHLNTEAVNIMTLEDPVEYPTALIRQISINETARLDFANGIRSLMRQDPDIILVGEIRDEDTASMAFRAALTGHQVFSTLHANSALGSIPRLLDIGLQPEIIAGNLIGVIAQRLARRLCPQCREAYRPDAGERALLGLAADAAGAIYRARGCPECDRLGYRGRIALQELLPLDPELDELIATRATQRQLLSAALGQGFETLAEAGVARVLDGLSSLAEIMRVVDLGARQGAR